MYWSREWILLLSARIWWLRKIEIVFTNSMWQLVGEIISSDRENCFTYSFIWSVAFFDIALNSDLEWVSFKRLYTWVHIFFPTLFLRKLCNLVPFLNFFLEPEDIVCNILTDTKFCEKIIFFEIVWNDNKPNQLMKMRCGYHLLYQYQHAQINLTWEKNSLH